MVALITMGMRRAVAVSTAVAVTAMAVSVSTAVAVTAMVVSVSVAVRVAGIIVILLVVIIVIFVIVVVVIVVATLHSFHSRRLATLHTRLATWARARPRSRRFRGWRTAILDANEPAFFVSSGINMKTTSTLHNIASEARSRVFNQRTAVVIIIVVVVVVVTAVP